MVYAPLLVGCTTVVFEGALDSPDADTHWRTSVEELGVTGIFTSPTAVRMLMRYGERTLAAASTIAASSASSAPARCSTRRRGSGCRTPCSADRIPVIDHMWQTETGGPVFGNPYGLGLAADQAGLVGHRRCPASTPRS